MTGDGYDPEALPERYVFTPEEAAAELLGVRPGQVARRLRYERLGLPCVYRDKIEADARLGRTRLAYLSAEMEQGR